MLSEMYEIQKLDQSAQVLVSNTFYPVNLDLEHAWYLLEDAMRLFGLKPHALRDDEAEDLWHVISIAEKTIYDALTYFYLTTGDRN